ncbi:hypothetical protein BSKO_01277 [Bryopsis sp. KO-2023]|nr:hypothetical protein BSKO_01277 [Bryopsis sp. KO-2023]
MVFSCFGRSFKLRRRKKPQRHSLPPSPKEMEMEDDDSQTSAASEWITTTQDIFASYATMDSEVRFAWLRAQLEDIHDISSDGETTTDKTPSQRNSPDTNKSKNESENSAVKLESKTHKLRNQELVSTVRIRESQNQA